MRSSAGSVTECLEGLKKGERDALEPLWERYFERLVALARRKLRGARRLPAGSEDVALDALDSFVRAAQAGRFPQLFNRDDLWQILVMLAGRKAHRLIRREQGPRQGGGKVRAIANFEEVISREPTPAETAEVAEECARLLDQLGDSKLRQVALWKLEGYTDEEIAQQLGCVVRTVERKLRAIRGIWNKENRL